MIEEWRKGAETLWRYEESPHLRKWSSRGVQDGKMDRPTYDHLAVRRYLSPQAAEAYKAGYEAGRQWHAGGPRHTL
jgi:hypothetical protein